MTNQLKGFGRKQVRLIRIIFWNLLVGTEESNEKLEESKQAPLEFKKNFTSEDSFIDHIQV